MVLYRDKLRDRKRLYTQYNICEFLEIIITTKLIILKFHFVEESY